VFKWWSKAQLEDCLERNKKDRAENMKKEEVKSYEKC
jgi:hypothetical protein